MSRKRRVLAFQAFESAQTSASPLTWTCVATNTRGTCSCIIVAMTRQTCACTVTSTVLRMRQLQVNARLVRTLRRRRRSCSHYSPTTPSTRTPMHHATPPSSARHAPRQAFAGAGASMQLYREHRITPPCPPPQHQQHQHPSPSCYTPVGFIHPAAGAAAFPPQGSARTPAAPLPHLSTHGLCGLGCLLLTDMQTRLEYISVPAQKKDVHIDDALHQQMFATRNCNRFCHEETA